MLEMTHQEQINSGPSISWDYYIAIKGVKDATISMSPISIMLSKRSKNKTVFWRETHIDGTTMRNIEMITTGKVVVSFRWLLRF